MAHIEIKLINDNLLYDALGQIDPKKRNTIMYKEVGKFLTKVGTKMQTELRRDAKSKFKIKSSQFLNSFAYKKLPDKDGKPPAIIVGTKNPWMITHIKGATIRPKGKYLTIPFSYNKVNGKTRLGKKALNLKINDIIRNKKAFIKKIGNVIILFEKLTNNNFNKKKKITKGKNLIDNLVNKSQKGNLNPIAVLVPFVTLKKRMDIHSKIINTKIDNNDINMLYQEGIANAISRKLKIKK